ncbi:MAG TPA: glycosyl hydrolase, partial [Candidatus Marinimicrobia bacterium]|nr:glycosyl hydrolase [Candidatus Neomarinimicrobiota bacterium]
MQTVSFFSILLSSLAAVEIDTSLFQAMEWRNIGPFRGGRSTAVAGVVGHTSTYYFGATGGGVWKTDDAGISWQNVSDGHFGVGSIGAIAVSSSNPNVVYVGTGTACVRGVSNSHGDGVYKSMDGGETWSHLGLKNTRHISKVIIHPDNPDHVYVAAQGTPWTGSKERGIYRSKDGGKTWEQIFFVDELASASDLSMDMTNPRVLYAAFWHHQRLPWQVRSGGPGSGIYKSTDGGDSWDKLEKGLPEEMGKTSVAVSPVNPKRVWVLTESNKWGLYRSDDGGKSFTRVNKDRVLIARSWYYIHVFADPQNENTVYVLNAPVMKSTDGGKTFENVRTPHGDNHDLWINPHDNQIMINGNDGGANVSFNGGRTWSTQQNQPTAQFYRVITDNRFPYWVYGGQQDNSSVAIASRARGGIDWKDWYSVAGCESAYLAFDPDNPVLVYGGCYQGLINELNVESGNSRSIMAYEYLGLGSDPIDQKYRFNWNAPIVASPHDPQIIYHAGNVVLKTEDRGESWAVISPDLTLNKKENLGKGGAPITNEAAGGEIYHTILYLELSTHEEGTIWAGSDDGLVHVTKDGGKTWNNVTPNGLKEGMVNAIDVSPHDPATAYIAFTRYKFADFKPYIYKTDNYGKTWKKIIRGISDDAYVRVVREDPVKKGLLYAGTELGLFVSFDDGKAWQRFQLNLPIVPITDLTFRNNDLVASTLGRAFWILDDLSPLQNLSADLAKKEVHLFSPKETL